jgi:hypothetical protein
MQQAREELHPSSNNELDAGAQVAAMMGMIWSSTEKDRLNEKFPLGETFQNYVMVHASGSVYRVQL